MLWFQVRILVGPPEHSTGSFQYSCGTVQVQALYLRHRDDYRQDPVRYLESHHPQDRLTNDGEDLSYERDAEDWSRPTEDEMVRGAHIQRANADRLTVADALTRYLAEVTPTKRPSSQVPDRQRAAIITKHLGKYSLAAVTPWSTRRILD